MFRIDIASQPAKSLGSRSCCNHYLRSLHFPLPIAARDRKVIERLQPVPESGHVHNPTLTHRQVKFCEDNEQERNRLGTVQTARN